VLLVGGPVAGDTLTVGDAAPARAPTVAAADTATINPSPSTSMARRLILCAAMRVRQPGSEKSNTLPLPPPAMKTWPSTTAGLAKNGLSANDHRTAPVEASKARTAPSRKPEYTTPFATVGEGPMKPPPTRLPYSFDQSRRPLLCLRASIFWVACRPP